MQGVLWPGRLPPAGECGAAQNVERRHHPRGHVFSAGIQSSLVQEKVKAPADNCEPRVAATGSLTLNFWTLYSMKRSITPSLAPQDVCERCSQEYSSLPTGETLCYVKISASCCYLRGS